MANPTDDFPAPFNRKNFSTNERLNWLEEYVNYLHNHLDYYPEKLDTLDEFIQMKLNILRNKI